MLARRSSKVSVGAKRELARRMRANPTPAEAALWDRLDHTSWCTQVNKLGYILDFYCPALKLAVEVDGEYHSHRKEYDNERDKAFLRVGIETVRISNEKVLQNLEDAFLDIQTVAAARLEVLKKKRLIYADPKLRSDQKKNGRTGRDASPRTQQTTLKTLQTVLGEGWYTKVAKMRQARRVLGKKPALYNSAKKVAIFIDSKQQSCSIGTIKVLSLKSADILAKTDQVKILIEVVLQS